MSIPQTGNTQRARLSEELKAIKVDVTTSDRAAAIAELGYSNTTIGKYLGGTVWDNDTALKLLKFFRQKIEDRDKQIA